MVDKKELKEERNKIDQIDDQILDLLQQRKQVVQDVLKRKVEKQLPVFVARREHEKTDVFREKAKSRGL
nr:bifunctional chorismate mutase/prephenate dehydrogenase [Fodinibius sp.]